MKNKNNIISIHSLHTEGDVLWVAAPGRSGNISIHSLHTEGDGNSTPPLTFSLHFNPLPPHGGRPFTSYDNLHPIIFQSTPSTRRETFAPCQASGHGFHFNPLPPHGGRRTKNDGFMLVKAFQSTPSTRRETTGGAFV